MSNHFENLDLIDLISERHIQLRNIMEKLWNEYSNVNLSNSEWFILSRIYQEKEMTITNVAKSVDISRQATHKLVKKLKDKGLVEVNNLKNNRKLKCVSLTTLGNECFKKYSELKRELERNIIKNIGMNQVKTLKEVLELEWKIDL